jgi:CheY-specific phosphatase CheX
MLQQKTATLRTIFSEVLANLAFMFTDEEEAEAPLGDTWLETVISYAGPSSGTLRFRCPTEFSALLAANLLGVDPLDDEAGAKGKDAVKGFMNIVCGQFITTVHGADDIFDLTIPEVLELPEAPDLKAMDSAESAALSVEGHLVQLSYLPQG